MHWLAFSPDGSEVESQSAPQFQAVMHGEGSAHMIRLTQDHDAPHLRSQPPAQRANRNSN